MERFELYGYKFKYERSGSFLTKVVEQLKNPENKSKDEIEDMCKAARVNSDKKFNFDVQIKNPLRSVDVYIYYNASENEYILKNR